MRNSQPQKSPPSSIVAQLGLMSVVAIVAGIGIWSQLNSSTPSVNPSSSTKESPAAASASAASALEPAPMVVVPTVDYTLYTDPAKSISPDTNTKNATPTPAKEATLLTSVVKQKEQKEQKDLTKKSDEKVKKIDTPSPAASSSVQAEKPKPSDFSYTQPITSSTTPSSAPNQNPGISSLESAKTVTVPKAQVFNPVVLEAIGDKAWVKISPTSTVIVEKGQELPTYGKLKSISATELTFEKGSIFFETSK